MQAIEYAAADHLSRQYQNKGQAEQRDRRFAAANLRHAPAGQGQGQQHHALGHKQPVIRHQGGGLLN